MESSPDLDEQASKKLNQNISPQSNANPVPVGSSPKLRDRDHRTDDLPPHVERIVAEMKESLREKVADMNDGVNFVQQLVKDALAKAVEAEEKVTKLQAKMDSQIAELRKENMTLREQLQKNEAYSRRNNVIICGVPEDRHGHEQDTIFKVYWVMEQMGHPNPRSVPIAKTHRLGPFIAGKYRDIIVRFERVSDRDEMLHYRQMLKGTRVFLKEDLPQDMAEARETLLTIQRAAKKLPEYRNSTVSGDKLKVNGRVYTTDTLDSLPEPLLPKNVASRKNNNTYVFFSKLSPLSNFWKHDICVDGKKFLCNEQYIQCAKAEMFGDSAAAEQIMRETCPRRMKWRGKGVRGVNQRAWENRLGDVLWKCNWAKYSTSQVALDCLLETGERTIGEAKPQGVAGIGMSLNNVNVLRQDRWTSRNLMGECLMRIRQQKKN